MLRHLAFAHRLPEAGPASAGVKLGVGIEQGRATADALVDARLLRVPVSTGEGPLGALCGA